MNFYDKPKLNFSARNSRVEHAHPVGPTEHPSTHLQYEARLSPGNPKLGLRMHPNCWQRREDTLIIPGFLCVAQNEGLRSPCT